jgi:hypothetical protein
VLGNCAIAELAICELSELFVLNPQGVMLAEALQAAYSGPEAVQAGISGGNVVQAAYSGPDALQTGNF